MGKDCKEEYFSWESKLKFVQEKKKESPQSRRERRGLRGRKIVSFFSAFSAALR